MKKLCFIITILTFVLCCSTGCRLSRPPLVLGDPVDVTTETVSPDGDTIVVDKPGDPLHGFTIEVPEDAYTSNQTFTISYQTVENYSLPADSIPLSPLVSVENGGQFSEQYMTVTIPVSIPEGHFAMAFFYDEESERFEAMFRVSDDEASLTVATRHFSKKIALAIPEERLAAVIDTEFKPGTDDWQFVNRGSYIAPRGHCAGQSMMAMYYYTEKKLRGDMPPLNGAYDNDGNIYHPTPDLWQDDVLAYKLCSVAQVEIGKNVEKYDLT